MEPQEVPSHPQETDALSYLKEHKILELFENLTSALVYNRPTDPKGFMREHIQQLQKARSDPDQTDPPSLVDESNIRSVFSMLDVAKKGYISHQQYVHAMENLGVTQYNQNPVGAELNKISQETFVLETKAALRAATATFLDYWIAFPLLNLSIYKIVMLQNLIQYSDD